MSQMVPILPNILEVEGVEYGMPSYLEMGHSIFLPCLNTKKVFKEVKRHYAPWGWSLIWAERVEAGLLGIRVWRV